MHGAVHRQAAAGPRPRRGEGNALLLQWLVQPAVLLGVSLVLAAAVEVMSLMVVMVGQGRLQRSRGDCRLLLQALEPPARDGKGPQGTRTKRL